MFLEGWLLMTLVAMVPATVPAARLVAVTRGALHAFLFLTVYVGAWLAGGAAAYVALSPLAPAVRWAGAGVALAATAVYEVSPLKDACLRRCRSPLRVLFQSSFAGGLRYAVDCGGCCVFLMALMVALGLMSFVWLLVLALVVLVQKVAPWGGRSPRVLALVLATAAVATWL